jgi:hypothetical protein
MGLKGRNCGTPRICEAGMVTQFQVVSEGWRLGLCPEHDDVLGQHIYTGAAVRVQEFSQVTVARSYICSFQALVLGSPVFALVLNRFVMKSL